MENIVHRQYLTRAGEGLLLTQADPDNPDGSPGAPSFLKMAERLDQFATDSGLDTGAFMSSPLAAVPLPLYPKIESGRRRWDGLNPQLMWHPLMWLHDRLAYPYLLEDVDENGAEIERLESPDELIVRVMLELTRANLYNPDNGGWVDILALNGLDVTDSSDVARVGAWLDGGSDPTLDGIDLAELVDDRDEPDWAIHTTQAIFQDVVCASWHIVATDLAQTLRSGREDHYGPEETRLSISLVAQVAESEIGDAVIAGDLNLGTRMKLIAATVGHVSDTELNSGPVQDALEALTVISQGYSQHLDLLENLDEEAAV